MPLCLTEREIVGHKIKRIITDNLLFLVIALLPYAGIPAIVNAQQGSAPELFTEPLSVLRGKITPQSGLAEVWPKDFYCDIVKRDWGWSSCEGFDAFIVGYNSDVDTLLIETPNSGGYVKFDDWDSDNLSSEVSSIEKELIKAVANQTTILGFPVEFVGWRAYPSLNKETGIMYYATDISFDGEISTNIKASVFDRYGFNVFRIIPVRADLSENEIAQVVQKVTKSYTINKESKRTAFESGDKIAAAGALAVLAGLVGVKYGKAAAGGLLAILLLVLKKAWFILLLPLIWIGKLFKRK